MNENVSLPDALRESLRKELGKDVLAFAPVGGGCIANAGRLDVLNATLFLKWSDGEAAHTFVPEGEGLRALEASETSLKIPEVRAARTSTDNAPGFLVLEWIEQGAKGRTYWNELGRGLAEMHRHTSDSYGFESDNFIGRLPQRNGMRALWPEFFREERLAPQVALARSQERWRAGWDEPLEALFRRLDELLPSQPHASILHGDLWSGNILATAEGQPAIIDPAVYYGHREADLAMTHLFGGFAGEFYDAYKEAWPLEAGYDKRRDIYNLYHLINHLNHFGSSYAGQVERILKRFA